MSTCISNLAEQAFIRHSESPTFKDFIAGSLYSYSSDGPLKSFSIFLLIRNKTDFLDQRSVQLRV